MNRSLLLLFAVAGSLTGAEMEMLPAIPVAAFGGGTRILEVAFRNNSDHPVEAEIRKEVFQSTSATAVQIIKVPLWKKLRLHARQTALEEVSLDLPVVRAETRFLVRFIHRETVLGQRDVWVYPSNVLTELNSILAGAPLTLDAVPAGWKEILTTAGVNVFECPPHPLTVPTNRIALLGPSAEARGEVMPAGGGIIQIRKLATPDAFIAPAYELVCSKGYTKVVAQESALVNLSGDPWAQLRLLRMARLAAGGEQFERSKSNTLNNP